MLPLARLIPAALLASPAVAFGAGGGCVQKRFQRRTSAAATPSSFRDGIQGRARSFHPAATITTALSLGADANDGVDKDDEDDADSLLNDQREGMADAFAALDSLSADDFDDLRPLSATRDADAGGTGEFNPQEAKLFMEMQAELSTRGDDGVYDDILGDLTGDGDGPAAPKSYLNTEEEDVTSLGQALDEAADLLVAEDDATSSILDDADGLGSVESSADNAAEATLTTADVSNDILTQEIEPSLSIEDFMTSAMQEAVSEIEASPEMSSVTGGAGDIAKTAEQLLEDEELRREIESIFDKAGEKLRLEIEAMRKEQVSTSVGFCLAEMSVL